ncbi:MAG: hypothetical protein HOO86_02245 [Bacteroidales bacterium]|nr:hypothetical protein [Bacteroidales bacterium]
MKDKHLLLLNRQLTELDKIGSNLKTKNEYSFGVNAWKSSTISVIERIFGTESRKIAEIEKITLGRSYSMNGPDLYHLETVKETGRSIIEACIAEIEILGVPEQRYDGIEKGINLTVVQSQSNQQKIKIELIVSALREELTGKQLAEIQDILDESADNQSKKIKTIDKLKSFGIDTLSGILSGLLTNPQIWGS